jgi:hypothetical protein
MIAKASWERLKLAHTREDLSERVCPEECPDLTNEHYSEVFGFRALGRAPRTEA